MATVRRVVCVLAAALCFTALCVAAAADTSAGHPTVGASDVSAKQTDVAAKTEAFEAASKVEVEAISFKTALSEVQTAREAAKKAAEAAKGILTEGTRKAAGLGYQASQKALDAVTVLKKLVPTECSGESLKFPAEKKEKAKGALDHAKLAVADATKAESDFEGLLNKAKTEEQKVEEAMEKAIQAATRIPGEAVKLLEVIRRAQEEASKAIAVVKKYLTEVEEGNKVVKNVLKETNAILSAATKVDKVAKRDQSNAAITKEECTELKQLTLDGFESVPLRVETQKGTRGSTAEALRETERLEALMKTAILSADNAVELATTEKSAAQAALQEATQELEAAKKKQQESEKQKEGILESEVSERDGEKGLNRPQQPDTTDATSNPPAGASLPTADGTADGEKLLAQHTDGSDVPAWVRAPLMLLLLLMACVAAW